MHPHTISAIIAFAAPLAFGAPGSLPTRSIVYTTKNGVTVGVDDAVASGGDKRNVLFKTKSGVTVGTDDGPRPDKFKREVLFTTRSGVKVGTLGSDDLVSRSPSVVEAREDWNDNVQEVDVYDDEPEPAMLLKRSHISSCGPKSGWIPVAYPSYETGKMGYNDAAANFCRRVYTDDQGNPLLIPAKGYAASNVEFEFDFASTGRRVTLKNNVAGYIEFEIHNKSDRQLRVVESDCIRFMQKMSEVGQDCYGTNNKDTKGGTWQEGDKDDKAVSYHGLPKAGNPQ